MVKLIKLINMLNLFYKCKAKFYFPIKLLFEIFIIIIKKNYSKYPKYLYKFEKETAKKFRSRFALSFSSGTAACFSSILSLGQKKKSLAFVSKLTFPSTIISLLESDYCIEYLDFDVNFNPIFAKLKNDAEPDLIILTHVFGIPVGFNSLEFLRLKYKSAKIIFDCSHAQGAKINDKYLNEYADITFFSIQGAKAISGGEGGVVLTNNEVYYNRMIRLSHPGRLDTAMEKDYAGVSMSLKSRMHPLAAIIANANLEKLDRHNNNLFKKIKSIYSLLSKENLLKLPNIKDINIGGFHYGLPFFSDLDFRKNIFVPIKSYNWPFYEKNNFYSLEVFNSDNFIEKEKKYLEITNFVKENTDIRSKLFFIDLDWIKFNSENYLINQIKNFLKFIK
jgi:dTDP-4-amino-4,6-dideoxygalactose transaminase